MQPQSRKRKHNRETIHFNLLLIGSNSMQRGCRAINVSQGGMLLELHGRRDDPEITEQHMIFVVGMVVDLLFIVGKTVKKSLNMAAHVVRNEGNLIGIEFFQPQPKLLAILTSRTSQGTPSSRTASVVERTMAGTGWLPEKEVKKSLLISFFTGLTLAVILVVIGLGLKHYLLQSEQIEKPSQLAGSIPETNFGQVVSMISSRSEERV